jgi:hypothetical protein
MAMGRAISKKLDKTKPGRFATTQESSEKSGYLPDGLPLSGLELIFVADDHGVTILGQNEKALAVGVPRRFVQNHHPGHPAHDPAVLKPGHQALDFFQTQQVLPHILHPKPAFALYGQGHIVVGDQQIDLHGFTAPLGADIGKNKMNLVAPLLKQSDNGGTNHLLGKLTEPITQAGYFTVGFLKLAIRFAEQGLDVVKIPSGIFSGHVFGHDFSFNLQAHCSHAKGESRTLEIFAYNIPRKIAASRASSPHLLLFPISARAS